MASSVELAQRWGAEFDLTGSRSGFHPLLDEEHPYIVVDGCMQAWPDADYANAHRHGITAYATTAMDPWADAATALEQIMFWHLIARQHEHVVVATSAADIRQAKADGNAAFILAAQGGDFIGDKLHRVEAFHRLGLRLLILSYNSANLLCSGILDRTQGGLTGLGELVVDECNRVGMVLDLTHLAKLYCLEIIERSSHPVVYTHSNPSALVPNPRNIDDEQIRACIAKGGVIGLAPWGPLVLKPGTTDWPTVADFVDLVDHVVQMTGNANHVAIGSDMSLGTYPDHHANPWGAPQTPNIAATYNEHVTADFRSPMRSLDGFAWYPEVTNLAEGFLARGYSEADVAGLLGGNYLRVFEQVWGG